MQRDVNILRIIYYNYTQLYINDRPNLSSGNLG